MNKWKLALLVAVSGFTQITMAQSATDEMAAWNALKDGAIVVFRHATAPGIGDPPDFKLGDCTTQRNLDWRGKDEAKQIGEAFRAHGIEVGAVLASQWCRTRETADLAFPNLAKDEPAFSSFFENASDGPAQTAIARAILLRWKGPGALVVVTHQVNITALTGVVPESGEGVVLEPEGSTLKVVGRITPTR